jgi:8-oxo-dGTP pyrophosphatase MutT (NUDIX family)
MGQFFLNNDGRFRPPQVVSRQTTLLSPWVSLETVTTRAADGAEQTFHAIKQADYVQVLCLHDSGQLVLVRQFRPILEVTTVELPGGLRDGNDDPALSARREVEEETGLQVVELVPLIDCFADVGRLTNRCYGFFALVCGALKQLEPEVEPLLVSGKDVQGLASTGQLGVPTQLGLLYLAAVNPRVLAICARLGFRKPPWMDED